MLTEWISFEIASYGLLAACLLMATNGFFSAPPSEIVLPLSGALLASNLNELALVILAVSLGNLAGTYVLFLLGNKYGLAFLPKLKVGISRCKIPGINKLHLAFPNKKLLLVIESHFLRNGYLWVLGLRVLPVLRSIVSYPAGALKMRHDLFLFASMVGILVWSGLWATLGYIVRGAWVAYKPLVAMPFTIALILFCIYFVLKLKKYAKMLVNV